ncbi:MAG TPA: Gfo/Idh/MocA family oxidoreductase [Clostridiaceae bacterium]|nr:Gfo/Idh/MocA family oxidoreductase [Clostridiaceae bacterium]
MGRLKFGIIGCGLISNWHADAILRIADAELVAATDVSEKSRKAFSEKYNVKVYDTVEELLADNVDVVSICTPSGLHAPLAIQAINAGKHVIIEKPMAITLEQADEIIEAAEKNDVKVSVISQLRFSNAVQRVKRAINENLLGKLVSGDVYMKFYRSQEYYDQSGWRGTWKMDGGGALMNQGIHGIDLLCYLMGPVKYVHGFTRTLVRNIEVEDTASAILEYENGALGVIQGTTSIYPGLPRRIEISGDKGTVILEEDKIVKWCIEGQETPADLVSESSTTRSFSDPAAFGIEGHLLQISDMVDAIKSNRRPMVDQYEGRKPVELILAIYESSRTGKTVKLGK